MFARIPDPARAWKKPEWVETSHVIDLLLCDPLINIHVYTIDGQNIDGCKKAVRSLLVTSLSL